MKPDFVDCTGANTMVIRPAVPDDAAGVFEVHGSNEGDSPWHDVGECREHVKWMISLGTPPIVAEVDGSVAAEMEIWWGSDMPELGTTLDISMLFVHRDHQHQGIGRALVEQAVEVARQKHCGFTTVWAATTAADFYRKLKFRPRLTLKQISVKPSRVNEGGPFRVEPTKLSGLSLPNEFHLQTQRILHPRQRWHDLLWLERNPPLWDKRGKRRPAILSYTVAETEHSPVALAVYRLAYWQDDPATAELYLWSADCTLEIVHASVAFAPTLGINTLSLSACRPVVDLFQELGGQPQSEEVVFARVP